MQEQRPATLPAVSECTLDNWRAGVKLRFAVTGQNASSIQLIHDGKVVDTKSIAFNLLKIASNYDVRSLKQFCQEWILPCIAIKTQEWVTAELME